VTATPSNRTTLWSPWTLAIAGLWGVASLLGFSTLTAPPGEVAPPFLVLFLAFGTVAAALMFRAPFRRVIVDGSAVTRVKMFGREPLRLHSVVEADSDGPGSLMWSTSVPVVLLDNSTEVALTELAGFDGFGRRNRRVQRACEVLSTAASEG